jgi:hypothetical protein
MNCGIFKLNDHSNKNLSGRQILNLSVAGFLVVRRNLPIFSRKVFMSKRFISYGITDIKELIAEVEGVTVDEIFMTRTEYVNDDQGNRIEESTQLLGFYKELK